MFIDIIGQQKQLTILRSALANGRMHHAYLFLGPDGVGKHLVAVAVAKAIHCGELKNDFCGGCVNCRRIADGNHPDVRVIEPLAGKKEISIQQIRELERELNYRSFTGERKIAIIDPATLDADGRCVFAATVDLEDVEKGVKVTYQIVGEDEADLKLGKISINSPIARSLIGKSAGDIAEVQAPGGVREYEILDVKYV